MIPLSEQRKKLHRSGGQPSRTENTKLPKNYLNIFACIQRGRFPNQLASRLLIRVFKRGGNDRSDVFSDRSDKKGVFEVRSTLYFEKTPNIKTRSATCSEHVSLVPVFFCSYTVYIIQYTVYPTVKNKVEVYRNFL